MVSSWSEMPRESILREDLQGNSLGDNRKTKYPQGDSEIMGRTGEGKSSRKIEAATL